MLLSLMDIDLGSGTNKHFIHAALLHPNLLLLLKILGVRCTVLNVTVYSTVWDPMYSTVSIGYAAT